MPPSYPALSFLPIVEYERLQFSSGILGELWPKSLKFVFNDGAYRQGWVFQQFKCGDPPVAL